MKSLKFLFGMINCIRIYLLLIFSIATCAVYSNNVSKLNQALDTLDNNLEQFEKFRTVRLNKIDSIEKIVLDKKHPASYQLYELGRSYIGFNNDRAVEILNKAMAKAHQEGDSVIKRSILIDYCSILPKSGIFTDAIALLNQMYVDSLTPTQKTQYYGVKSQIMIDASKYPPFKPHEHYYDSLSVVLLDSLKQRFTPGTFGERLVTAQILLIQGDETLAFSELNEALEHIDVNSAPYAILTAMMANYFKNKPERVNEYLYYLTQSANSDVVNANGDAASLLNLGNEMFQQGDYDRAFTYLTAAGKFMAESGSRTMLTEMASPIAVYSKIIRKRDTQRKIIVAIVILIAVLIVTVVIWGIHREHQKTAKLKLMYDKLKASVNSRDEYIGELLNLCSVYVEGMEDYNRLISRKLKANQAKDLLKTVESGKLIHDQAEKFFVVFDHAILRIYPNFVNDINKLLQPDKQLSEPENDRLLPELRIAAFMRLGVTDSSRLSKFLGLSLNTIYTYRNRLKSRAINRSTFESDMVNLGDINM